MAGCSPYGPLSEATLRDQRRLCVRNWNSGKLVCIQTLMKRGDCCWDRKNFWVGLCLNVDSFLFGNTETILDTKNNVSIILGFFFVLFIKYSSPEKHPHVCNVDLKWIQNDFPFAVCNVRSGRKLLTLLSFSEAQMTSKLTVSLPRL